MSASFPCTNFSCAYFTPLFPSCFRYTTCGWQSGRNSPERRNEYEHDYVVLRMSRARVIHPHTTSDAAPGLQPTESDMMIVKTGSGEGVIKFTATHPVEQGLRTLVDIQMPETEGKDWKLYSKLFKFCVWGPARRTDMVPKRVAPELFTWPARLS